MGISGKKKAVKAGKLSFNLAQYAKSELSTVLLPFSMDNRYIKGNEPPALRVM